MDKQRLEVLEKQINDAVDRALAEEVKKRTEADRKFLDAEVLKITRARVEARKADIVQKVDAWLDKNVEPSIAVAGKAMIDAALAEVRARVLGRR